MFKRKIKTEIIEIDGQYYARMLQWHLFKNYWVYAFDFSHSYPTIYWRDTPDLDKGFSTKEECSQRLKRYLVFQGIEKPEINIVSTLVNGVEQINVSKKELDEFKLMKQMLALEAAGKDKQAKAVLNQLLVLHELN